METSNTRKKFNPYPDCRVKIGIVENTASIRIGKKIKIKYITEFAKKFQADIPVFKEEEVIVEKIGGETTSPISGWALTRIETSDTIFFIPSRNAPQSYKNLGYAITVTTGEKILARILKPDLTWVTVQSQGILKFVRHVDNEYIGVIEVTTDKDETFWLESGWARFSFTRPIWVPFDVREF